MKRYFLFRGKFVFAVDSETDLLPLEAIHFSDYVFEYDQFGMIFSVKDRRDKRFKLFDSVNAMFKHVEKWMEISFDDIDGIQKVTMSEIVEKIRYANHETCDGQDL